LIEPSSDGYGPVYYACAARLKTGERYDCVYLCEGTTWHRTWGPHTPSDKWTLDIAQVEKVEVSPNSLPAHFATKLYEAGESGMGYTIFTVDFSDGTSEAYSTGNAVSFVVYPPGKSRTDVIGVHPHAGRDRQDMRRCPDYRWCLFTD
jgi:hypothetical protein